ncbi:MAG: choice-of-anchor U domain-containing protein [Thermodesulfobacteriota bacterium]
MERAIPKTPETERTQVQVALNAAGNVATVTYGAKVYTIDASARPGATINANSIDIYKRDDFPNRNLPPAADFPDDLIGFTVMGLNPGETIVVTLTFPSAIPPGTWYYKANAVGFYQYHGAAIVGNTVTLTLTDNGPGDEDNIPGQITDPGGPGPWQLLCNLTFTNRNNLAFGASDNFTSTDSQEIFLQNLSANQVNWAATPPQGWNIGPESGTGNETLYIWPNVPQLPEGSSSGVITINDLSGESAPINIFVSLNKLSPGTSQPPFGAFSTPKEGSTVSGSVRIGGWALDDVQVQNVAVYRNSGQGDVFVDYAVFEEGSRPDVEGLYPTYPMNGRAGWGYMMQTNLLPDGTTTFSAVATDREGNHVNLGSRTVTVDNANAVKPFGAIDAPSTGETASGNSFRNFGWALTPQPNKIPVNGSTINIFIDGVNRGQATYNLYRQDIANLYPGYQNSEGAGYYFDFDTTGYSNGIHTITWTATDNAGNTEGIGSRYFTIVNQGGEDRP